MVLFFSFYDMRQIFFFFFRDRLVFHYTIGCTVGDHIRQKCLIPTAGSLGHWKALLFLLLLLFSYGEIKSKTMVEKNSRGSIIGFFMLG